MFYIKSMTPKENNVFEGKFLKRCIFSFSTIKKYFKNLAQNLNSSDT